DAERDPPVVADHEVVGEPQDLHDAAPSSTSLRRRSTATSANELTITNASTTGSAASPPGQLAPTPSVVQKMPNVVSMTPTANFIAFSGTRASGARTATPTPATRTSAAAAPAAASGIEPCALPNGRTMNTTSSPSSSTPLKAVVKPDQSTPATSSRPAVTA